MSRSQDLALGREWGRGVPLLPEPHVHKLLPGLLSVFHCTFMNKDGQREESELSILLELAHLSGWPTSCPRTASAAPFLRAGSKTRSAQKPSTLERCPKSNPSLCV